MKQEINYIVEPGKEVMFYMRAYTSDPYLLNLYRKQLEASKIEFSIQEYRGGEHDMLCDRKVGLTISDKLKPYWSYDKTKMVVVSDHLKSQLRYCIPDDYMNGFISNMASYIIWILLIFDEYPSIRKNFTDEQLKSIQVLTAYALAVCADGISSSEIDHIMLISNLWGWGE